MNETERLLAAVVDMQHYVTHDVDQGKCAACQRWDELQSAAMAAAGRIDALSAELAALRAERDRDGELLDQRAALKGGAVSDRRLCEGGVVIGSGPCIVCGRTAKQSCGRPPPDPRDARIAELEAQCESAHAAQRHAEKELAQYMAWYAMAEHQHLHEQRRAEKAEAEVARLRMALEKVQLIAGRDAHAAPVLMGHMVQIIGVTRAALGER